MDNHFVPRRAGKGLRGGARDEMNHLTPEKHQWPIEDNFEKSTVDQFTKVQYKGPYSSHHLISEETFEKYGLKDIQDKVRVKKNNITLNKGKR